MTRSKLRDWITREEFEQQEQMLRLQFDARERQYRDQYPTINFDLVLHNANPVGSLYVQLGPDEFVLIDITLLPEQLNPGMGAGLVGALIETAQAVKKTAAGSYIKGKSGVAFVAAARLLRSK
jgi:hypothetical protein